MTPMISSVFGGSAGYVDRDAPFLRAVGDGGQ